MITVNNKPNEDNSESKRIKSTGRGLSEVNLCDKKNRDERIIVLKFMWQKCIKERTEECGCTIFWKTMHIGENRRMYFTPYNPWGFRS